MTKNEKQTEQNRIQALIDLNGIISLAESQLVRAKGIPLIDDDEHADWVQGYVDRIHEICMDMKDLVTFGHLGGFE